MKLRVLALTLGFALLAAACSDTPSPLVVGDETTHDTSDVSSAIQAVADDSAPVVIGLTEMRSDMVVGDPKADAELASLGGTAWALFEYDGEFYESAVISISSDADGVRFTYRDACTSGSAITTGERLRGRWVLQNEDAPEEACPGFPSSLFVNGTSIELHQRSGELSIGTEDGYLRAQHWMSASKHDTVIEVDLDDLPSTPIPDLPAPNLTRPVVDTLAEVNTVADLPFPECASNGRRGIEPNPILREGLVWSQALSEHFSALPYVAGLSGGASLYSHEVDVGLSARYEPTLTWLAENVPEGIICLDVPPLNYYASVVPDLQWTIAPTGHDPAWTGVELTGTSCALPYTNPEISYGSDEIEIRFPGQQREYGVDVTGEGCEPTVLVELSEPIGDRKVVPRFTD